MRRAQRPAQNSNGLGGPGGNEMKISAVEPGSTYRVDSDSGGEYYIRYVGSGDADPEYVATYKCDCPAGIHGRACKHLRAFLQSSLRDYDPDDSTSGPASITV